jgi:hypothetical protein
MVVQLMGRKAVDKAIVRFNLSWDDFLVLLLMEKQPDEIRSGDKVIKMHSTIIGNLRQLIHLKCLMKFQKKSSLSLLIL